MKMHIQIIKNKLVIQFAIKIKVLNYILSNYYEIQLFAVDYNYLLQITIPLYNIKNIDIANEFFKRQIIENQQLNTYEVC